METYKNIKISVGYQRFCMKPSEQGSFSKPVKMSPNSGMLRSKLTKTEISQQDGMINISAWNLQNRARFSEPVKWVQIVVCYNRNLQKHKYLSGISMFLHETFRTGLIFPRRWNWVQIVVCYDQNLQKHKYISGISTFLHETFRTGLIFASRSKWVQIVLRSKLTKTEISEWDINVSARNLQNRACFSEPVKMSPNSGMLWSKLTKT